MSDYIFHPRFKFPVSDHNNIYYGNAYNPFRRLVDDGYIAYTLPAYLWGRFWEIIDWYIQDPTTDMPEELGKIEETETDSGTITIKFMSIRYWYAAFDNNDQYYTYVNVDHYRREATPDLGDVACFKCLTDNRYYHGGIVEKIYDDVTNYKISSLSGGSYNNFTVFDVENDEFTLSNRTYKLDGFILNPINQLYNVIAGREIYWKLPFWMYKRYLDRRRGLIYE